LPQGKQAPEFIKKPDIALKLIDKCLEMGEQPGVVLIDAGYGNNSRFLQELEIRKLRYIGGLVKNRKILVQLEHGLERKEVRLDELAKSLNSEVFTAIQLKLEKSRLVWVATIKVELSTMSESKTVAIVMNAPTIYTATEVDYLITNASTEKATGEWIVTTYSKRNWVEVFYREAKGWLGLKKYQVRGERSLYRHWILVFCTYSFIVSHRLTGGLRRSDAHQPLETFTDALSALRIAIPYRFVRWLQENVDVLAAYKASLGSIWA
jgi:SRSO17 transposase